VDAMREQTCNFAGERNESHEISKFADGLGLRMENGASAYLRKVRLRASDYEGFWQLPSFAKTHSHASSLGICTAPLILNASAFKASAR
jgi:hypothetical protein